MSSDEFGYRFRNKSDWFGMNFNPKLLSGRRLRGLELQRPETLTIFGKFSKVVEVFKKVLKVRQILYIL